MNPLDATTKCSNVDLTLTLSAWAKLIWLCLLELTILSIRVGSPDRHSKTYNPNPVCLSLSLGGATDVSVTNQTARV